MAVDDYGIEAIRKAAVEVDPGDKSNYALQVTPSPSTAPPATEATLANVLAAVDGLEGFTDGIEGKLDTLATNQTNATQFTKISDGTDTADVVQLGTQVTSTDKGLVTNAVIHGKTTAGGGGYVDVKVTPSGAMTTETEVVSSVLPTGAATETTLAAVNAKLNSLGQKTMANSVPIAIASDQSNVKTTLYGTTDTDAAMPLSATGEGHMEVEIHGPKLPFHSIHTENLTPIFQNDAVYGINSDQQLTTISLSGVATASDSLFSVSTGTTLGGFGTIQSKRRLRYKPGQGIVCRFTAMFTSPVANSYQLAGLGHAEDGLYVGYKNTSFGILHNNRGVRETQTLTITTASTTNQNCTVTLAGTAFAVPITNSASTAKTAYEISNFAYTGWNTQQIGSTVVFVADSVGNKTGTFSLTATTAVGAFVETKAGAAATETFIAQSSWNGDKLDGTGASGVTIDPTKLNIFELGIQYLGAGTFTISAEVCPSGNNATMVVLHQFRLPNTLTTTSFGNPAFPFTMAAYSAGSTTNLTVKVGSYAGFIEGGKFLTGPRFSYFDSGAPTTGTILALFTVQNALYFGGRSNQSVINVLSITAGQQHNNLTNIFVIKNGTLSAGNPSFAQLSSNSTAYIDNGATAVTYTNDQLVWSMPLGATSNETFKFDDPIELQPGDYLTFGARTAGGTATNFSIGINMKEDQ